MGTPMELNRVLIVDDDPAIRRVVSALLDLDEYGLLEAADGQAALEVVRDERPDLVILDLNLPKLSGHEVLQQMRANPELRRIPVAILTTSAAEKDVVKGYDLGANCYLTKPVDVEQFVHVVQSIEDFWLGLVKLPPR